MADNQYKWAGFATPSLGGVETAGNFLTQGLTDIRDGLEAAKAIVQAKSALVTTNESAVIQAANAAINLLISGVNSVINQTLGSTSVYLLPIMIPKKGLYRYIAEPTDEGEAATNTIRFPANNIIARASAAERQQLRESALLTQLLNPQDLFSGGNAYYLKTIFEALFDPNDPNRPKFEESSAWAYSMLIAGGTDVTSLIQLAGFLQTLFEPSSGANGVGPSDGLNSVVPQGVRVSPSGTGGAVVIQWDLVPASQLLASYDQSTVEPIEYAIIRSTDMRARSVTHVRELFSTTTLTEGLEGLYGAKVLAVKNYDGIVCRYIDTTAQDAALTYYYHVAFSTRIRPASAGALDRVRTFFTTGEATNAQRTDQEPVLLGYDLIGGGVPYRKPARRRDHVISSSGTFPDWLKSPSLVSSIPSLGRFFDIIQAYLTKFQEVTTNITTYNDDFINFLNSEINKYTALSGEITQRIDQIVSVFSTPHAGIFVNIRYGTGNIGSFLSDMVTAFEDTSDPNRPPFTSGDEFVTGVIVLGVGPDAAQLQALWALMKALLDPSSTEDPALTGIRSINTALATVEAGLVAEITGGTNAASNPSITFGPDMTPLPPGTADAAC